MSEDELNLTPACEAPTARPVAPEDLRPGDYVAALNVVTEHLWQPFGTDTTPPRLIRVLELPGATWHPMQVQELCLPFVLFRAAGGKHHVLDVRQYRLARVSETFARRLFEALAPAERTETGAGPAPENGAEAAAE